MEIVDVKNFISVNNGVTMTKIANGVGLSKPTDKLKRCVEQLLEDKIISRDETTKNFTYHIVRNQENESIKDNNTILGHTIQHTKDNKIIITTPQNKKIKIDKNAILLLIKDPIKELLDAYVIKKVPGKPIKTKEEILKSILNYRAVKNLVSCVTIDLENDEVIKDIDDVILENDTCLLIYQVSVYNKAA